MESELLESTRRSLWSGKRPGIFKRMWLHTRDLYYWVRDLPYNISKMFQWFPIIWKDRDWDFLFLLLLIQYKLGRMRRGMFNDLCCSEDIEKITLSIKQCEDAITRLTSCGSSYIEQELTAHEAKWGSITHEVIDLANENLSQLDIYSPKARKEGKEAIERDEIHKIYDLETVRRQDDLDLLFNTMKNNIQNWWS